MAEDSSGGIEQAPAVAGGWQMLAEGVDEDGNFCQTYEVPESSARLIEADPRLFEEFGGFLPDFVSSGSLKSVYYMSGGVVENGKLYEADIKFEKAKRIAKLLARLRGREPSTKVTYRKSLYFERQKAD